MLRIKKIKAYERGLLFKNGEFKGVLNPGPHRIFSGFGIRIDIVSVRTPWLRHPELDKIVKSA